jgi:hypothetical protein
MDNHHAFPQPPGNYTVCPGERITYSLIPTPNYHNCTSFAWTVSNGSFSSSSSLTSKTTTTLDIDVFWNDSPSTGTLSVTATGCTEGSFTTSSTYAIKSLAGQVPINAHANQLLPYCSTNTISLSVNAMLLLNTGGSTGITQQFADGYEWSLPTGWNFSGSSNTNFINIYPDNGCRGGTVTVKAYVNCNSGRKYSAPASININRPTPSLSVTPPVGYTGPSCGAVQPITFTVTPLSCASTYTWVFNGPDANTPTGWLTTPGPVTTTTNYITVTPSGGARDAGSIQVTANLSCGTQLPATLYILDFKEPEITVASAICFGGTNVTVTNVASGITVNWSLSSYLSMVSGQGTSSAVIRASTADVRTSGTINATVSCPNTIVPQKTVWVGSPVFTVQSSVYTYEVCAEAPIALGYTASTTYQYISGQTWSSENCQLLSEPSYELANVLAPCPDNFFTVIAGVTNNCGTAYSGRSYYSVSSIGGVPCQIEGSCGGYFMMSVTPNPTSDKLTITIGEGLDKKQPVIDEIRLYNQNGEIVFRTTEVKPQLVIETKPLVQGTYYLHAYRGKDIMTRRVVIDK